MTPRKPREETLKFDEALARLEEIVETLEAGEVDLEKSLELFEEGRRLGKLCTDRLQEMEQKVRKVLEKADGSVELREMETGETTAEPEG
jgi:exodeoxyribonuclease VII small subunit